jgi:hypothetical protein
LKLRHDIRSSEFNTLRGHKGTLSTSSILDTQTLYIEEKITDVAVFDYIIAPLQL